MLLTATADGAEYMYDADHTPYYYCLSLKKIVSDRIDLTTGNENAALLKGMLFGDTSDLSYSTSTAFRSSGIAHLLAVSGLHTALWCGILLAMLKAMKAKDRTSAIVVVLFLFGFMILSAFTPSVIRASVMMTSLLVAPLFNRKGDSLNTLGLAATIILIANPYNALNVSFQLSVCATLGILCAEKPRAKLCASTSRIPIEPVRSLISGLLSGTCVSVCASIFTLPVSAYYFGVFNLLSPLGNLLCVSLAFCAMITGIVGIFISFIPTAITSALTFAVMDLTELLLDAVTTLAKLVSSIPFATVPVHKDFLFWGLFICTVIISIGYLIYKRKFTNKYMKIAIACISLISLGISIAVPLTATPYSTTITVLSSGNSLHLIIRSGTDYAYISHGTSTSQTRADYLPKATSESLKYYVTTHLPDSDFFAFRSFSEKYSPEEIRVSDYTYRAYVSSGQSLPYNTIIKTEDKYVLSDEITFEIIDTYHIKYVIIKSNEKTVFVHLYGELDATSLQYMSDCDVIITNTTVPQVIPPVVDTVIISADATALTNPDIDYLQKHCGSLLVTARSGDVTLMI